MARGIGRLAAAAMLAAGIGSAQHARGGVDVAFGRQYIGVAGNPSGSAPAVFVTPWVGLGRLKGGSLDAYAWLALTPRDGTDASGELDLGLGYSRALARGLTGKLFAERWQYSRAISPPGTDHDHVAGAGMAAAGPIETKAEYRKIMSGGHYVSLRAARGIGLGRVRGREVSLGLSVDSGYFADIHGYSGWSRVMPGASIEARRGGVAYHFDAAEQFGLSPWARRRYAIIKAGARFEIRR